jgi:hypothetical protein
MTPRPHRSEDKGLQLAERLVALLTGTEDRLGAATRHQAARADPARDSIRVPDPVVVTWARAQLREQIQRAGAELGPALQPPGKQPREADPSPYADREPEP